MAKKAAAAKPAGDGKERFASRADSALLERVRNAAYWTPGLGMVDIIEAGIEREITRLEKAHGGPFKARPK